MTRVDTLKKIAHLEDDLREERAHLATLPDDGKRWCPDCHDSYNIAAGCECGRDKPKPECDLCGGELIENKEQKRGTCRRCWELDVASW